MRVENRPKVILSDIRLMYNITRVGPTTEKLRFHSGQHDYNYVYKVAQGLIGVFYRRAGMTVL